MSRLSDQPRCCCGKRAILKACWSDDNVGRKYWISQQLFGRTYGNQCMFEEWYDEPINQEYYKSCLQYVWNMNGEYQR